MSKLINKKDLISVNDLAKQLNCQNRTINDNAKKLFPNKIIENGKTTYYTEEEATMIINKIQNNNNNQNNLASSSQAISTSLTPALKIKQAMEMMQEAYEEELEILRLKNEEQQKTIDNYRLATEKKIEKQKLFSEINRLIRKKAFDNFNGVFEDSYRYYYKELANRHNFIHKVDMTFLKQHKEYAQELLEMLL